MYMIKFLKQPFEEDIIISIFLIKNTEALSK